MSKSLRAVNIKIPTEVYDQLKILSIVNKMTMKDVIIKAIMSYQEMPTIKSKVRNLQHQVYRLQYDSHKE